MRERQTSRERDDGEKERKEKETGVQYFLISLNDAFGARQPQIGLISEETLRVSGDLTCSQQVPIHKPLAEDQRLWWLVLEIVWGQNIGELGYQCAGCLSHR